MTILLDGIKKFKDCGIVLPEIVLSDVDNKIDFIKIKSILEKSYPLIYDSDEDKLYYIDESSEKFLAPDLLNNMSYSNSWLS